MNNFNFKLKYLVIAMVIISLLMVGGAYLFSKVGFKTQKLPALTPAPKSLIQTPSANVNPTAGSLGEPGQQPGTIQKPVKPVPIK